MIHSGDRLKPLSSLTTSKMAYRHNGVVYVSPAMLSLIEPMRGLLLDRLLARIPCRTINSIEALNLIGKDRPPRDSGIVNSPLASETC